MATQPDSEKLEELRNPPVRPSWDLPGMGLGACCETKGRTAYRVCHGINARGRPSLRLQVKHGEQDPLCWLPDELTPGGRQASLGRGVIR